MNLPSMNKNTDTTLKPFERLIKLLSNERKDIGYIYFYAITVGLISLILPLGVQAIFNFVKTGSVFSSVYLLIVLVIIGLVASGVMQIIQVSLVEVLQKRIFAKAAFEFTYRLPRIQSEALLGSHPPELMNRFFDVLTIQKSLPKFLIDITAASLQILFGLLLLSFYHPFFIAFAIFLVFGLIIMVRWRGKKGLETSIKESKYKYQVVQWLEEIANTVQAFKLAGNTNLPIQKMDGLVNNYLSYRSAHFKILKNFYVFALIFKTLIIGGLLILGTYLLVNLKISLGQFVASEIIIVLLTGAVEKLILSIDIIFDLLTAVDKIGHVTDLPNEKQGGALLLQNPRKGITLRVAELHYQYPNTHKKTLSGLSFAVEAGERICITGQDDVQKNTLAKILAGILGNYQGSIQYNGFSMKDLDIVSLRDLMALNIPNQEVFDGSILENLTMGHENIGIDEIQDVLTSLQLNDPIALLPDGLNTQIVAGGYQFSTVFITKIALARLILSNPQLLIYNDFMTNLEGEERQQIAQILTNSARTWTLIVLSNEPTMMAACQRTLTLT